MGEPRAEVALHEVGPRPGPERIVPAMDCVLERSRTLQGGDWNVHEVWHVARSRGRTADFAPIRCSDDDEGVTLPGPIVRRQPTCCDCIDRVAHFARGTE